MVYKLDALAREADREPFEFEFSGELFTLPTEVDLRAAAALQEGDLYAALRTLLGEEQYQRLKRAEDTFTEQHLANLMEAWGEHLGVDVGESPAPSRSSRRATARSKPTSNGSTGSPSRTPAKKASRGGASRR